MIETIPHNKQRYDTAGDWFVDDDGILQIKVSKTTEQYEWLVGIHELTEAILCLNRGVLEQDVSMFDEVWLKDHHHPGDEPGDSRGSPYQNEHNFATAVERMLCAALKIKWQDYDEAVEELSE